MEQFEISVAGAHGVRKLLVRPRRKEATLEYEIWEADQQIFSLECCSEPVADSLKLTAGYASQFTDISFVQAVADVIQSKEK